jgi:hypothetical protein
LYSSDTGENWQYSETEHKLSIDLKKSHDSVRREVLYSIPIEFGVPMKLVRLIKMCKYLSDKFPVKKGPKQGDALSPCFSTLL